MNNSFGRLIDGMCATLRAEVLTRLDDEFARGQVFGVINLLNTFKVRADWSAEFLLKQIAVQRKALDLVATMARESEATAALPTLTLGEEHQSTPISDLLTTRDRQNRELESLLAWLEASRADMGTESASRVESLLRTAMREELSIELKHSPRPLFAEMSSGQEAG